MVEQQKWALITGASSGLGEEFSKQLAAKGYYLVVVARRAQKLEELKNYCYKNYQVGVEVITEDITQEGVVEKIRSQIESKGIKISLLINNAGVGFYGEFQKMSTLKNQQTIQLNISSLTDMLLKFIPHMLSHGQKSHICNVASVAGYIPVPQFAVYSGTKAYVQTFSECVAQELGGTNISVSTLSPGGVITEFSVHAGQVVKSNRGMMTCAQVVEEALRGIFNRKRRIIPGFLNKFLVKISHLMPMSFKVFLSGKVMASNVNPG